MAKDPAFLFYYSDFLVGTSFFSNEETGAYIRLLCHMADKGRMTKKRMLSVCYENNDVFDVISEKFCIDNDGFYYQKRLEEEVEKRKSFVESRRLAALAPKNKRKQSVRKAYAKRMEDVNINVNKDKYREFILLKKDEYSKLVERLGKAGTERCIEILDNAIGAKGYKYKSHYRAILSWVIEKYEKEKGDTKPQAPANPIKHFHSKLQNAMYVDKTISKASYDHFVETLKKYQTRLKQGEIDKQEAYKLLENEWRKL